MTGIVVNEFPHTAEGNRAFVRSRLQQRYPQYLTVLDRIDFLYKRPYASGEPVLTLDGATQLAAFAAERIWN